MKTVKIKLYKYSELSEESQQRAICDCGHINLSFDWWEHIDEDAKNIGLRITQFDIDRNRHANGDFFLDPSEVAANIFRDHGEQCKTFQTAAAFMNEWEPVFSNYMDTEEGEDELVRLEGEFLRSLLEDYSILLQKEYEHLTNISTIIESIEANDYDFTEDGRLYNEKLAT